MVSTVILKDPVMPGCLISAMWQLVGFYLGWMVSQEKVDFRSKFCKIYW